MSKGMILVTIIFSQILQQEKYKSAPPFGYNVILRRDMTLLYNFQRPKFPIPTNVHRASLRKRSGYHKPISLHFLLLLFCHFSDFWWEGLVYCGAFARTIKKILPQGGSSPEKESFICFGKEYWQGEKWNPWQAKSGCAEQSARKNEIKESNSVKEILCFCFAPRFFTKHQSASNSLTFHDVSIPLRGGFRKNGSLGRFGKKQHIVRTTGVVSNNRKTMRRPFPRFSAANRFPGH